MCAAKRTISAMFVGGKAFDRLEDCLRAFADEERLDGAAAFECTACEAKSVATKTMRIRRFPQCLVIHINRFKRSTAISASQDRWIKYSSMVNFPITNLRLAQLGVARGGSPVDEPVYDLYAVINHYGSRDIGHYTAYCKVQADAKQPWLAFDDDKVSEVRVSWNSGCAARVCVCAVCAMRANVAC